MSFVDLDNLGAVSRCNNKLSEFPAITTNNNAVEKVESIDTTNIWLIILSVILYLYVTKLAYAAYMNNNTYAMTRRLRFTYIIKSLSYIPLSIVHFCCTLIRVYLFYYLISSFFNININRAQDQEHPITEEVNNSNIASNELEIVTVIPSNQGFPNQRV